MFKLNDGKLLYSFKNGNKKIQAILEKDYQEANKLNATKYIGQAKLKVSEFNFCFHHSVKSPIDNKT